jgi:hypothetical protein
VGKKTGKGLINRKSKNPHPFMGWGLKSSEDIFGNFIFYKNFQKINYNP